MARAAEILGVAHVWLGFDDSGYHEGAPETWELPAGSFGALDVADEEIAALVKVVREFRPHVMTTYDENGGYPHPDHIRCHVVSMAAFEAAGDPEAYPERGRAVAAAEAVLQRRVLPRTDPGHQRRGQGAHRRGPVRRVDPAVRRESTARSGPAGSPPGSRSPILRARDARVEGTRDPDRPGFALVRHSARPRSRDLGDRRLRAGQVAGRRPAAGGRPVRGGPGAGARHECADGAVPVVTAQLLADGGRHPSDVDPITGKGPEWGEGRADRAAGHPADGHRGVLPAAVDDPEDQERAGEFRSTAATASPVAAVPDDAAQAAAAG